jgi:hypothetical protein
LTKYIITGVESDFTAKLRTDLDTMLNAPPAVSAPRPPAPPAAATRPATQAAPRPAGKPAPAASGRLSSARDGADSFRGRLRSSLR